MTDPAADAALELLPVDRRFLLLIAGPDGEERLYANYRPDDLKLMLLRLANRVEGDVSVHLV